MTTSTRRKSAIANAKWILSQRVFSDNVAAQNGTDGQGLFSFRSVTSTFDSDGPWGKFNWNFLLGVFLATGVSAVFWAGVAIFLSGVLR